MSVAVAELQEPREITDLIDEVVSEVVTICAETGFPPAEAARRSKKLATLSAEELLKLALIGLARMAQARLPKPSNWRRKPQEKKGSQTERRQVLYERSRDSLSALFQGADGQMRTLYAFSIDDHRARLSECETFSVAWRKASRFHQEALTALKRSDAETIGDLNRDEQERLRRIL